MEKSELISYLLSYFEPELAEEMSSYPIFEAKAGTILNTPENQAKGFFPFVLSGHLSAIGQDTLYHEFDYYKMKEGESCVVNITNSLRMNWGVDSMFTELNYFRMEAITDSKILGLPTSRVPIWMEKYVSWNKFALQLYQKRLGELFNQFDLLAEQKNVITNKSEQITSSIQYAQRIQEAVLNSNWSLNEKLPEHFVLFKPRDIVSGDFYWMSQLQSKSNNTNSNLVLLAAADCTGHGVPGAFMSMLGISFLNEIINHYTNYSTDGILNLLREKVKNSLQQSDSILSPSDGMDIALCLLDLENNKLQYSGAYNPLYIVREGKLIELQATKNPIGKHTREIPFTTQEIDLKNGDLIYTFSDGYKSQFGGVENRTFKAKNFKETILKVSKFPIEEQQSKLEQIFEDWRGDNEQTDDVLVIGIRI